MYYINIFIFGIYIPYFNMSTENDKTERFSNKAKPFQKFMNTMIEIQLKLPIGQVIVYWSFNK